MNLRNWSKEHTMGLIAGIMSPLIFIPLVILVLAYMQNYDFSRLWNVFLNDPSARSKIVSLSIISNLLWFYLSINREKYNFGMGIIIATFCYLPYIVYVNFIL